MKQKILATILVILQLVIYHASSYSFQEYKHNFQKDIPSSEEPKRKQNFDRHQQYVNQMKLKGQTIPPNSLMDLDQDQLKALSGLPIPDEDEIKKIQNTPPRQFEAPSVNIPPTYNFVNYGHVSPVKNQGGCGSCWAFAAAAEYESLLLLLGSGMHNVSQQMLLQCTSGSSCNGGWPHDAINVIKDTGIPQQSTFPYAGKNSSAYSSYICNSSGPFVKIPANITRNQRVYNAQMTQQQIKQLLLTRGPIIVGVKSAHNAFWYPNSDGVIVSCPAFQWPDHVVLLVGYTNQSWIVKNSWGNNWGDNGYGYIPFSVDCGVTNFIWQLEVDKPLSIQIQQPQPQPTGDITLTIHMTDSYGDGWNNNIFAFKQNNQFVALFGENFTSGFTSSQSVVIPGGIETDIVVYQYGSWRYQVGFTVYKGSQFIYKKDPQDFSSNSIFYTFNIASDDNDDNTQNLFSLILTDSWGDGWNGNTIIITQGSQVLQFGEGFTSGSTAGPYQFNLSLNEQVVIKPGIIGTWRNQIGFKISDNFGFIVAQRIAGSTYYAGDILLSFIPGSVNALPVRIMPQQTEKKRQVDTQTVQADQQQSNQVEGQQENQQEQMSTKQVSLMIAVICLSVVVVVLIGVMALIVLKISKKSMRKDYNDSIGTASNLQIPAQIDGQVGV